MIDPIFQGGIYIQCQNDYEFKQANDYLNSIGIKYYTPEDPHPEELEKQYNSYIYLSGYKILYRIHYTYEYEELDNTDSVFTWSHIKWQIGYIDINIDDIISNLDKLEDKYK